MYKGALFKSNKYGVVEVVKYENKSRVLVKFLDTGNIDYSDSRQIRSGALKDHSAFDVVGVGRNDLYRHSTACKGKCYQMWFNMLFRCYNNGGSVGYEDCWVCTEWLTYSKFREWFLCNSITTEFKIAYQIDKDLKVYGNKIYSPDTCFLVSPKINTFLTKAGCVYYVKEKSTWYVASSAKGGKTEYISGFSSKHEAKIGALSYKIALADSLASEVQCPLISSKLKKYFRRELRDYLN